jgi:hypothetical protein
MTTLLQLSYFTTVRIVRWTVRVSVRDCRDDETVLPSDASSTPTPAIGVRRPRMNARAHASIVAIAPALLLTACGLTERAPFVRVAIDDGERFYADSLAVPSPIPLPMDAAGRLAVDVRLLLPDGAEIDVDEGGALVLPSGARIDRVERWRATDDVWRIADVRGARVDDDGTLRFHVLRPEGPRARALFGAEFTAGDDVGEDEAHAALAHDMRAGRGFAWRIDDDARRTRAALRFVALGACNACHAPMKPEETRADARLTGGTLAVHRATGMQGFYTLDALFHDDGPIEDHRPMQPAFAHGAMRFTCGDVVIDSPQEAACDDGRVMRAHLDVHRALRDGDPHARGVCDARVALAARMTMRARESVADTLRVCGDVLRGVHDDDVVVRGLRRR